MPAVFSPQSLPLRTFCRRAVSLPAVLSAFFLAALLGPLPAMASPDPAASVTEAAQPEAQTFSALQDLRFPTPASFAEIGPESELFQKSAEQAVRRGSLIKLWLPRHMAKQYSGGSPDAVTRQILLTALPSQDTPLDAKDAELLARSAEGQFVGFSRIPKNKTDTPAQEEQNRAEALRTSLQTGRPLLVDSLRTSSAYLHTCLIHFAMGNGKDSVFLPCAMATAVVPVKDTVLFLTVSSLLGQEDAEPHLEWVKETAITFSDALVKANRTATP